MQSSSYLRNSQHNRIVASEFGTLAMPDPCKSVFGRFLSRFELPRKSSSVKNEKRSEILLEELAVRWKGRCEEV